MTTNGVRAFILWLIVLATAVGGWHTVADAQDPGGMLDRLAPLFELPRMEGEFRIHSIITGVSTGKQVIPQLGLAWDLRNDFGLNKSYVFVDLLARIQIGLLSFRAQSYTRDLAGLNDPVGNPNLASAEARFIYTGFRLGVDFDVYQWGDSRVGMNFDYDLQSPAFTEAIATIGGKRITGDPPVTGGLHVYWNPKRYFFGVSGVLEAKARWPMVGTEVTEWELSGGIRSVQTALGAVVLKGGYRLTSLRFYDSQLFHGIQVPTRFDADFYGWFAELCYNY